MKKTIISLFITLLVILTSNNAFASESNRYLANTVFESFKELAFISTKDAIKSGKNIKLSYYSTNDVDNVMIAFAEREFVISGLCYFVKGEVKWNDKKGTFKTKVNKDFYFSVIDEGLEKYSACIEEKAFIDNFLKVSKKNNEYTQTENNFSFKDINLVK